MTQTKPTGTPAHEAMPDEVERALARELRALDDAEAGASGWFGTWTTDSPAVVVGRGVDIAAEVDESFCRTAGIAVIRRMSGGRSVFVGPGTLQYGFVLPYALDETLGSISGAKRFCNALVVDGLVAALAASTIQIVADASGDLVRDGRKVAGLAMRRRRRALLLHGTILASADLATIAHALRHPQREPAYRGGRSHEEFLENLGALDARVFEAEVRRRLGDKI